MCVATTAASSQHLVGLMKKAGGALAKRGGVFRGIEHLGVRPLAHRMKAHSKYNELGRYVRMRLQASPAGLEAFQHRLRIDEEVIRFITLKQQLMAPKAPESNPLSTRGLFNKHGQTNTKHTDLDFFVARELLRAGRLTPEQVDSLPRHYKDPRVASPHSQRMPRRTGEESKKSSSS
jgi:ribosomal protein S6